MMFSSLLLALCMTHLIGCVTSQDTCDMRAVLSRLNALENEVRVLQEENAMLKQEDAILKQEDAMLKQEVDNLKQANSDQENTLFMVSLTEYSNSIVNGAAIIWDKVIIDKGNNFDTIYGKYTAPYNGYYQITVQKRSNDDNARFHLRVNEALYYYNDLNTEPNDYPSACVTVNLKLKQGDTIRVQNYQSTVVYGTHTNGFIQSWFTGFMLYRTDD